MPLTHFRVEEWQPCADDRLVSLATSEGDSDLDHGCSFHEATETYFDERYREVAAGVTDFTVGQIESESGISEVLEGILGNYALEL